MNYTTMNAQRPTFQGLRVRSPQDAHVIFHAVNLELAPIVARRLDTDEKRSICSGSVYVWEERSSHTETTGLGIERWTDSIRWGPSRVKDDFLYYHERRDHDSASSSDSDITMHTPPYSAGRETLTKQTYSVFVETPRGRRKWHLIAYFTSRSLEKLQTVDDIPILFALQVPPGKYKSARSARGRKPEPTISLGDYTSKGVIITPASMKPSDIPLVKATHRHPNGELAPLTYLQNITPPRRHPFDEELIMSFDLRYFVITD